MNDLDSVQKEIVNSTESKILVVAGSGSGKTRVLTERIKHLLSNGVNPKGIVYQCRSRRNEGTSGKRSG